MSGTNFTCKIKGQTENLLGNMSEKFRNTLDRYTFNPFKLLDVYVKFCLNTSKVIKSRLFARLGTNPLPPSGVLSATQSNFFFKFAIL